MNEKTFLTTAILTGIAMVLLAFAYHLTWMYRIRSFAKKNNLAVNTKFFSTGMSWGREFTMTGTLEGKQIKIIYPLTILYGRTSPSFPLFKLTPKAQVQVFIDNQLVFEEGYWYIKVSLKKIQSIIGNEPKHDKLHNG